MDKSKLKLMDSAPVRSAILRLALPTMLAMAVQIIYNMTDTFFIGRTGDYNLVAAISLITPLFIAIQAIGNIFGIGGASYISRKLGEGDFGEAKHATAVAAYSSLGIGIVLTAVLLMLHDPLLVWIGTSAKTFGPASEYFSIIASFSTMLILTVSLSGLVRSEGATGKAMIGIFIGVGVNIVLDPVFILVLDMGIAGAAWATVIGNGLGMLYYVLHFVAGKTLLSVAPRDFRPSWRIYGQTFMIGIPAALSMVVMTVSMMLSNKMAASYGDYVVAGNGIQMRVTSMCIMLLIGMAQGLQPFAGYNFGAKNFKRLTEGLKTTMIYSTALALACTALFYFFGKGIISVVSGFLDDESTLDAGNQILQAIKWGLPTVGIQMSIMVTFQATGKAIRALLITLGRQCIIFIPLLYLLNNLFGFSGYIYAQPVADFIALVFSLLLGFSFIRKLHTMEDELIDQEGLSAEAAE